MEKQLLEIKNLILAMGGSVEKALFLLSECLRKQNKDIVANVRVVEDRINQLHLEVDAMCMKVLATQSPVARDLRLILAAIKMNADLERMGDQCMSISYATREYLVESPLDEIKMIQEMQVEVQLMLRKSLDCFIQANLTMAEEVLKHDDLVDQRRNKVVSQMIELMKTDSKLIPAAMDLIFMARNFERIADHCTNIAEDVIFAYTGRDIRHGGRPHG